MGQPKEPRCKPELSVWTSGVDSDGQAFSQLVTVGDISKSGARLQSVSSVLIVGATMTLQDRGMKAEFTVVRVGSEQGRKQGEVGLQILPSQPDIRGAYTGNLPETREDG